MKITTIYIFNENEIIKGNDLNDFALKFQQQTSFDFSILSKENINGRSTVFKKFSLPDLDFTIYDHGYVMVIEGDIKKSIILLRELDRIIDTDKVYYLSPTQRIENIKEYLYPRNALVEAIARFLDSLFNNKDYSSSLNG